MASSAHHSARPPAAHEDPERPASGGPSGEESELQVKKLSPTGLVASGAAAATATVVGGQLGIAGTVIGAALTSVVSATALALYTDSVNRSRSTLKKVTAKGPKRSSASPSQSVHSSRTGSRGVGREDDLAALGLEGGSEGIAHDETPSSRRRIVKIALLAAVIALIGIAAVFGVQRVIGTELSPGTGQIQRTVTGNDSVAPRDDSSTTDDDQQDGTDTEQQEDGSPATERPDDSTDGTDTQQEDRSTQDENEAPQDTEAPAEQSGDSAPQGSGSTSNHGSRGSSQGDSGGQQGASAQRAAGAQQDSVTDAG